MTPVLDAVRSAYAAGLCPLPTADDGSKRPALMRWREYTETRPDAAQMRAWNFGARDGFGVVGGPASGCVDPLDFDDAATFEAFVVAADACGLGDVVARIRAGFECETPSGGRRWLVRYPASLLFQDTVFARRPGPPVKTLIEITLFSIVAPSNGHTHPSGKPYVQISGGFASIASYTADEREALFDLARSFDQMPRPEVVRTPTASAEGRPGDHFNRRTSWDEILKPAGWTHVYDRDGEGYWRRPGKACGISATTNYRGSGLLKVFSSSTGFDAEHTYSRFGAYALLEHAGDYSQAARALALLGYGRRGFAPHRIATIAGRPTGSLTDTCEDAPTNPLTDTSADAPTEQPVIVHLSDVEPEAIAWRWPGRIADGKLCLVVGDPGVGKSWITLDIAARVTTGGAWPDGDNSQEPGDVLLMTVEDGLADTIRPRLDNMGADVQRVHHLAVLRAGAHERGVQLGDVGAIEEAIRQTRARVVIIDPLSAYVGDADSHRDSEVRGLLAPLALLADRQRVALIGVMHLSKGQNRPAVYRPGGSIAFAAAARLVLAAALDPERDDQRLLVSVKQNICAPAPALA